MVHPERPRGGRVAATHEPGRAAVGVSIPRGKPIHRDRDKDPPERMAESVHDPLASVKPPLKVILCDFSLRPQTGSANPHRHS